MTLMEVILAIAILGGSLAALGELLRAGARASRAAQTLSAAQLLADSLTAEISASSTTPKSTEGVVEQFGGSSWAYTVQVNQVEQQGLLGILVTVRENLDQSRQGVTFSLVRWMIDPQVELDLETAAAEMEAADASAAGTSSDASAAADGTSGGER